MKIQDLVFVLLFLFVAWRKNSRLATITGLTCLVLAMPLFGFKTMLYTAERLTWYAAGFFLYVIILLYLKTDKNEGKKDRRTD
jgi:preprotein translocase subunit SecG